MTSTDQDSPLMEANVEAEAYDPLAPTKGPIAKTLGALAKVTLVAFAAWAIGASAGKSHWAFDLLTHFTMQALVASLVATMLAFALAGRRWGWFGVAICLVFVARFFPTHAAVKFEPTANGSTDGRTDLKLIVANVQNDASGYASLLNFVRDEDPDVFLVLELSKESLQQLKTVLDSFPHRQQIVQQGSFGVGIFSKLRIAQVDEVFFGGRVPSLMARLELAEGRTTQVLATHPFPPVSATNALSRNQQLSAISENVANIQEPLIVAGDLNCSPWSSHFKALLREGKLHDTGSAFQPSWPSGLPWPFRIPIDHVLVNGRWSVVRRELGPTYASDHLPVVVELQLDERIVKP